MKKEYALKQKVWIHNGELSLVPGRIVEIIDLSHLGEGHSSEEELYIVEIDTGIDNVYEVRSWKQTSPDAWLKSSLNPCEPKNHKTTESAKMILPAPVTKERVFSKTLIPTFLNIGIL